MNKDMNTKEAMTLTAEDQDFTQEESKNQMRVFENDFIQGLIMAADYMDDIQSIEIARNGKVLFSFRIRPLAEESYIQCKKKHTKYVRNKQLGVKMPEDTNTVKYRSAIIYEATIPEDREKLWDNKKVWQALNDKDIQIMNGLDVIENTLRSGEKERVIDCIDKLSGYDSNLEEVAKN